MPINNDLLNGIISGLGNIPKKSEIDTPTNNIDLEATETEAGLMSAADKKSFNELITSVSNLTSAVNGALSEIESVGKIDEYVHTNTTYQDINISNFTHTFKSIDGNSSFSLNVINTVRDYHDVSNSHSGLMTVDDKLKLDGISEGANKYILPKAGSTLGGVKTTSTVTDAAGLTPVPIIDGVPYYKNTTDYVLPVASNTTFGGVKTTSTVISTSGLTPCPIIAGVPYYDSTHASYADTLSGVADMYHLGTLNGNGEGQGPHYQLSCQHNIYGDNRFGLQMDNRSHEIRVDYATAASNVEWVATVGSSGCNYTTILEWANAVKGTGYAFITDPNYPSDGPVENEAFLEVHSDASNTRKVVIWRRFLNSISATKYRFIVNGTWWDNNSWQDA